MSKTMTNKADSMTRKELMALLTRFVNQRPGFDPMNYDDAASYRGDQRTAQRQRADALAMLGWLGWHDSITADDIRKALRGSGRLQLRDSGALEYCTGRYWPTEFRVGVCRVLSSIIRDYLRENMPAPINDADVSRGVDMPKYSRNGHTVSAGDYLRAKARAEFDVGICRRWFC
jgi:hypothetical protein